jgi:hypothetical protein
MAGHGTASRGFSRRRPGTALLDALGATWLGLARQGTAGRSAARWAWQGKARLGATLHGWASPDALVEARQDTTWLDGTRRGKARRGATGHVRRGAT